jgi:hypothetical protein
MSAMKKLRFKHLAAVVTGLLALIGLTANIETFFPSWNDYFSSTRQTRLLAVDCRERAYQSMQAGNEKDVKAAFRCAERNFKRAAKDGDALAVWGLALVYGDPQAARLLETDINHDFASRAELLWCKARRLGVSAAAVKPPFRRTDPC